MKYLVHAILSFGTGIISTLLGPIDDLIVAYMPNLEYGLVQVANFFNWLVQFVNWALSWLPLSANTWNFIISILIFRLTVPLLIDGVKLLIKWWHYLVP